jgi:predicted secreted protein
MSNAFSPRGLQLKLGSDKIAEITKVQMSGSKSDLVDVTNMDSGNVREFLATLIDSGDISFDANYIPGDSTQASLLSTFNNQTLSSWQIVLPSSAGTWSFSAYVSSLDIDLPIDKQGTISGKLKITGTRSFA